MKKEKKITTGLELKPVTLKKGYKKTKLGLIPKDWEIVELNEVGEVVKGLTYSPKDISDNGVLVLRSSNVQKRILTFKDTVYVKVDKEKYNAVKENDILICVRNGSKNLIGKNAIISKNEKGIAFGAFMAIYRSPFNNYFFQLFDTDYYKNQVHRNLGATINSINNGDLKKFKFPLPPKPQQQKIAKILSTWDLAINKQTQLIQAKQKQKKALMQLLLTGKKRFDGFTEVWKKFYLKDVTEFKNGKGHEKNIDVNGKFTVVNSKFISTEGKVKKYSDMAFSPLQKDDIVLVMSDIPNGKALAKTFLIDKNETYTLNQRICSLKTKRDFDPKFLFYLINRNNYFLRFNDGVKQTNLRKDDVLFCSLKVPSFKEQQKIAQVLSKADQEISLLKDQLMQLQQQKQGLMQVLLTGKVLVSV